MPSPTFSEVDMGGCLRVGLDQASGNVSLDWSDFAGTGTFIVREGSLGDYADADAWVEGGPLTGKSFEDCCYTDTAGYWWKIEDIDPFTPPAAQVTDSLYFYHDDHLGTPQMMTDSAGQVVWRVEQYPFGGIYQMPVATIENNLRFPGQYWDAETGLAQNYMRYYDPAIGRYSESDPLLLYHHESERLLSGPGWIFIAGDEERPSTRQAGCASPYQYAADKPLVALDPLGMSTIALSFGGTAGIWGGGGTGGYLVVQDNCGNLCLMSFVAGGGLAPFAASGGISFQWTSAHDVYQYQGFTGNEGGSFGEIFYVGADAVQGSGYGGWQFGGGLSIRNPFAPIEVHGFAGRSNPKKCVNIRSWIKQTIHSMLPSIVPFW